MSLADTVLRYATFENDVIITFVSKCFEFIELFTGKICESILH